MIPQIQGQSSIDYSLSGISGTMAAGLSGGSEVFQFRWASTTRLAVIKSVTIDGLGGSATAFTAGFGNVKLFVGRGSSANGSGGTALTPTVDYNQARSADALTALTDARISSTAALTAATGETLDAMPIGQYTFTVGTGTNIQLISDRLFLFRSIEYGFPLTLAANEGLVITATVPATGTWQFGATVQWQETVSYR
jgi:hypothetical protein